MSDRWTMRFAMRLAGIVAILTAVAMALLGVYVLELDATSRSFLVYWTVFFVVLLTAVALAVVDAAATFIKFRKEHMRLRNLFRRQM